MENEAGGELPYPKAQRLRAEGKSDAAIVTELVASGLSREDAEFVISSMPGGNMSALQRSRSIPRAAMDSSAPEEDAQPGQGGGALPGWVWFVLVYGVGNLILYSTTGIFLIPIPRK